MIFASIILSLTTVLVASAGTWKIKPTTAAVVAGIAGGLLNCNLAFAADTSIFSGNYKDPFHPGCLRAISSDGPKITITGRLYACDSR
jgi:hypothetical protein